MLDKNIDLQAAPVSGVMYADRFVIPGALPTKFVHDEGLDQGPSRRRAGNHSAYRRLTIPLR